MPDKINIKYKDRLFRLLFGAETSKENILQLYNALNDTTYNDPNEVELCTIDDVIYIKMKNDVDIDRCIKENVLVDFLRSHRAEVRDMCITEYNEETFVNGIRAEGIEEGIKEGIKEGIEEGLRRSIVSMLKKGRTIDEIVEFGDFDRSVVAGVADEFLAVLEE